MGLESHGIAAVKQAPVESGRVPTRGTPTTGHHVRGESREGTAVVAIGRALSRGGVPQRAFISLRLPGLVNGWSMAGYAALIPHNSRPNLGSHASNLVTRKVPAPSAASRGVQRGTPLPRLPRRRLLAMTGAAWRAVGGTMCGGSPEGHSLFGRVSGCPALPSNRGVQRDCAPLAGGMEDVPP